MTQVRHMRTLGPRLKAAMVLTGRPLQTAKKTAADTLGMKVRTFERLMASQKLIDEETISMLAAGLGVPEWFLRDGFDGTQEARLPTLADVLERIDQLHADLADSAEADRLKAAGWEDDVRDGYRQLVERLERLEEAVRVLTARSP